jgi:hypothetical protein
MRTEKEGRGVTVLDTITIGPRDHYDRSWDIMRTEKGGGVRSFKNKSSKLDHEDYFMIKIHEQGSWVQFEDIIILVPSAAAVLPQK